MRFKLFETALGCCAIVWTDAGVAGMQLPEPDDARMRKRLARRFPDAGEAHPPPAIDAAISGVITLFAGEPTDLSGVTLDTSALSEFQKSVYAIARMIPPGETLTYGAIAEQLGGKALAREVGETMGKNPFPVIVPCHRVVAANGRIGGFSAPGGTATKLKMLAIEGAAIGGQPSLL